MSRFLTRSALALVIIIILGGCQEQDSSDSEAIREEGTPTTQPGRDGSEALMASMRAALASERPRKRWDALSDVRTATDIPVEERAALLVAAMRREIQQPDPSPPIAEGAYLPAHDFLMLWQTRTLGDLAREDPNLVSSLSEDASGELRERVILAMGYAGDRSYIQEIRRLLAESTNWQVRSSAAFVLGEMKAVEAAPELKQALQDDHLISFEENSQDLSFYPVRQQAQGALKKLGYSIKAGPGRDEFLVQEKQGNGGSE